MYPSSFHLLCLALVISINFGVAIRKIPTGTGSATSVGPDGHVATAIQNLSGISPAIVVGDAVTPVRAMSDNHRHHHHHHLRKHHNATPESVLDFDYYGFLQQYGYIEFAEAHVSVGENARSYFYEVLTLALKTYQGNFELEESGVLDDFTKRKMLNPRCGVRDCFGGVNTMRPGAQVGNASSSSPFSSALFNYFPGRPKWSHFNLNYTLLEGFPPKAMDSLQRAFDQWEKYSSFRFIEPKGLGRTDMQIGFYSWDHGDGISFDGRGGALAHAFRPEDGRLHFDDDESWSFDPIDNNSYDFQTVALHELGHLLGLEHSMDKEAVMYPDIAIHQFKDLDLDDIIGLNSLYG